MISYSIQLTYHTVQYCMMKNHSNQLDDILHLLHHIQSMYSYHICYPTVHHTILEHDQLCYAVMCYHYSVGVLLQHFVVLYKDNHCIKCVVITLQKACWPVFLFKHLILQLNNNLFIIK